MSRLCQKRISASTLSRHTHFQNGCATGALAKIHFRHARLTHGLCFCSFLYKIKFNYSAAKHEAVALGNEMSNILRKPQKEQFCQNLNVSTSQEAFEAAVVLELTESSLCLNGTIAAKQLSFFGGNILVRLLTHLLKFPADRDLFSPVLIFCLAADRTVRTVRAVFAAVKQKTRVVKPFG